MKQDRGGWKNHMNNNQRFIKGNTELNVINIKMIHFRLKKHLVM